MVLNEITDRLNEWIKECVSFDMILIAYDNRPRFSVPRRTSSGGILKRAALMFVQAWQLRSSGVWRLWLTQWLGRCWCSLAPGLQLVHIRPAWLLLQHVNCVNSSVSTTYSSVGSGNLASVQSHSFLRTLARATFLHTSECKNMRILIAD